MPDVDLLPLVLPPSWKAVHDYLVDGASIDDVAGAAVRALAQTLRDVNGVPRLREIAEDMHLAAHAAEYELDLGLNSLEICRPRDDDLPTMIAEQVVSSLVATRVTELALATPEQALQILALEVAREFACHYGFDRIAVLLLRDPEQHPVELAARIDLALAHPLVVTLAARFAGNPTATRLRAPSRPGSSPSIPLDADLETFR